MGHADPPDSFAESRCFIYNWFYSHLLHACFEEAQGFWLKKDLQLSNKIFISDALQQHLHLNLKLHFAWCFQQQLADKCLHDSEVWGLQVKAAPFSWAEVGNSPRLPVPTLMLKGDVLRSVFGEKQESCKVLKTTVLILCAYIHSGQKPVLFNVSNML